MMAGLAAEHCEKKFVMIDSAYLKTHRTATSIGIIKEAWSRGLLDLSRLNTKLQEICDSQGRPINLFITAGQVSEYTGARALPGGLPNVEWLLEYRG